MNDPNIHLVQLSDWIQQPINSYKKKAIELGISMATGDIIVTTDADCLVRPNWLRSILASYQDPAVQLVAAPVMFSTENNFLSIFQALDFMTLQGITGAAAYQQVHSMCNGANLSYRKSTFIEVGGFLDIDTQASGDDMMLMHKIYRRFPKGIRFLKSKEATVTTSPMRNWSDFLNQRIRWASKADRYEDKRIIAVLVLVYFFNAWIAACGLAATVNLVMGGKADYWWLATGLLLLVKTAMELYFLFPVARFFQQLPLLWWFPFAQPFHILYTLIAGWLGKFGSYRWKGRVVR